MRATWTRSATSRLLPESTVLDGATCSPELGHAPVPWYHRVARTNLLPKIRQRVYDKRAISRALSVFDTGVGPSHHRRRQLGKYTCLFALVAQTFPHRTHCAALQCPSHAPYSAAEAAQQPVLSPYLFPASSPSNRGSKIIPGRYVLGDGEGMTLDSRETPRSRLLHRQPEQGTNPMAWIRYRDPSPSLSHQSGAFVIWGLHDWWSPLCSVPTLAGSEISVIPTPIRVPPPR